MKDLSVKKKTLTKRALIDAVAKTAGMTHQKTREVVQLFLDSIIHALAEGNRLEFRNFGIFEWVVRRPKQGRDLKSNQPLMIPSHRVVKFTPGKSLRSQAREKEEKQGDKILKRKGANDPIL